MANAIKFNRPAGKVRIRASRTPEGQVLISIFRYRSRYSVRGCSENIRKILSSGQGAVAAGWGNGPRAIDREACC